MTWIGHEAPHRLRYLVIAEALISYVRRVLGGIAQDRDAPDTTAPITNT